MTAVGRGPILRDPLLCVLADTVDDLEKVRIALTNRTQILTRTDCDRDGEFRGHGLTLDNPEVAKLAVALASIADAETEAVRNLEKTMRGHPLSQFQRRYRGIGAKQFGRLLATIGDPYFNDLHQRPRTVGELWAYCGFHVLHAGGHQDREAQNGSAPGVAPRRRRGHKSNWSEHARRRTWLIAEALMKSGRKAEDRRGARDPLADKYRIVYEHARLQYADALHRTDCVRCGPAAHPAPPASPLSDGHKHARALRAVSKELLRDLWLESRHLHGVSSRCEFERAA